MLFKYGHKMRLTVPHELGQLFNSKRLDIMLIDVINDFPEFFHFYDNDHQKSFSLLNDSSRKR